MAISIKRYKNEWDSRRGFRAYNGGELAGQILADFSKESGKVRVQLYTGLNFVQVWKWQKKLIYLQIACPG